MKYFCLIFEVSGLPSARLWKVPVVEDINGLCDETANGFSFSLG